MQKDSSLDQLVELLAQTAEPAFVVDGEGRIVHWNRAAGAFFGVPAAETVGRHCAAVLRGLGATGEFRCRHDCPVLSRAAHDDSYVVADLRVPTRPLPARWNQVRVHHLPLEDDSGRLRYLLHVITDVRDEGRQKGSS